MLAKRAGVAYLLKGFLVFLARTLVETVRNNSRTPALFCVIAQLLLNEFHITNNSSIGQLYHTLPSRMLQRS